MPPPLPQVHLPARPTTQPPSRRRLLASHTRPSRTGTCLCPRPVARTRRPPMFSLQARSLPSLRCHQRLARRRRARALVWPLVEGLSILLARTTSSTSSQRPCSLANWLEAVTSCVSRVLVHCCSFPFLSAARYRGISSPWLGRDCYRAGLGIAHILNLGYDE